MRGISGECLEQLFGSIAMAFMSAFDRALLLFNGS